MAESTPANSDLLLPFPCTKKPAFIFKLSNIYYWTHRARNKLFFVIHLWMCKINMRVCFTAPLNVLVFVTCRITFKYGRINELEQTTNETFLPTRKACIYEPHMSYLYFQMTSLFKWWTCFLPDAHRDVFWYLEVHLQITDPSQFCRMTDQTLNTVAECKKRWNDPF